MLLSFDVCWRAPEEIVRLARLAVVARDVNDQQALRDKAELLRRTMNAKISLIDAPVLPLSSTDVRRIGFFEQMTPPPVAAYIRENRLYEKFPNKMTV